MDGIFKEMAYRYGESIGYSFIDFNQVVLWPQADWNIFVIKIKLNMKLLHLGKKF